MTRRNRSALIGMVVTAAVLLVCDAALARAGGGGGYSGGSRGNGGFSGGGGGGDGGAMVYLLIRLVIQYPLIGIPAVVVVAGFFYYSSKNGYSAHMSHTIRRSHAINSTMRIENGLEGIRQRDPEFDAAAFLARCRDLLPAVQAAWSQQDMTPVRHFLSDGVFDRFSLQIEMQKGSGIRNDMREVRVLNSRLVGSASDRFFDTLHLAISAQAVDTTVALDSGRRLQGNGSPEPFTEIWTFLRRPGAKTLARPGLLEGYCPNCGTQLTLSTSITCGSCQALINSGEYDWVLCEITQQEAWASHAVQRLQGVAELQELDPGFNAQAIEDRVSAIFWHHRAAEFFGSDAYLNAVALPAFVAKERAAWQVDEKGRRCVYADAAVGSVDLAGVTLGDAPEGLDRVRVRVQWSGHRELRRVPGVFKPEWERSNLMRQEYVLVRKHGVKSVQTAALTSLHCPGCGAPQVAEQDGSCRYCGMPQNDGSHSWVLESVSPFSGFAQTAVESAEATPSAEVLLSPQEQDAMLQSVVAIMLADGAIDPREQKQLTKMAAKHGVAEERLSEMIRHVQQNGQMSRFQAEDWKSRNAFLSLLVRMCLADGNVSSGERQVLRSLVSHLHYTDIDIDAMIRKERAALYAASKATIKASRH